MSQGARCYAHGKLKGKHLHVLAFVSLRVNRTRLASLAAWSEWCSGERHNRPWGEGSCARETTRTRRPYYGHPPCGQLLQVTVTPCVTLPVIEQFVHRAPAHAQVTGPVPQVDSLHIETSVPPSEMLQI